MGSMSAGHSANGAVVCGGNRTGRGGKQERVVRTCHDVSEHRDSLHSTETCHRGAVVCVCVCVCV